MRALIIGCGYIGLPVGAELARLGHKVSGIRRSTPAAQKLQGLGITPLVADITRPDDLGKLTPAYDWVVNCVSSSHGDEEAYREVYLQGTRNVLKWLATVQLQKFVYTSSTSVYGQTDGSVVTEESPTEPVMETGKILAQTERVLLEAVRERDFPAVILRVAGIYGPGRGYWLNQYLEGKATLAGDGQRLLNMIHRDDVVGAIIAALTSGRPGQVYNAVDDESVTQYNLFQWLSAHLGTSPPQRTSAELQVPRKRGVTNKRVSNWKLKAELGYRFNYPTFRQGFEAELKDRS